MSMRRAGAVAWVGACGVTLLGAVTCAYPEYRKSDVSPYGVAGAAGDAPGGNSPLGGAAGVGGTASVGGTPAVGGSPIGGSAGTAVAGGSGGGGAVGGADASCDDAVRNQDETDVDCGGSWCMPCGEGQACVTAPDCASGNCLGGRCACRPGSRRCDGDLPQLCVEAGFWQDEAGCPTRAPLCRRGHCVGPSCIADPTCPDGATPTSCCAAIRLGGGTYPMGRGSAGTDASPEGSADEQPEHDATLSPFALDQYLVTVARFRAFVEQYDGTPPAAGAGAHPSLAGSGWNPAWDGVLPATAAQLASLVQCNAAFQTWTDAPSLHDTLAMNCVDFYQAFAFCVFDGGRLPTEAEWEYAAAGGEENRLYPWGAEPPDASRANYFVDVTQPGSPFVEVGSTPLGSGRWGHADLAGTVYEWALDLYSAGYYALTEADCTNCANLSTGGSRVLRGGHWASAAGDLRAANRMFSAPELVDTGVGLRCARDP